MWILGGHWPAKLEYLVNVRLVRDCLTNQNQNQDSASGRQSNTFFYNIKKCNLDIVKVIFLHISKYME